MLKEEMAWVVKVAAEIAREECARATVDILSAFKQQIPKPVEVDIDGIVKKVLDKIKVTSAEATEIPKKGKEK